MSKEVPSQTKTNREDALLGELTSHSVKDQDAILHVEKADDCPMTKTFDNSIDDTKPSKKVWSIVLTVAMGGFLFG